MPTRLGQSRAQYALGQESQVGSAASVSDRLRPQASLSAVIEGESRLTSLPGDQRRSESGSPAVTNPGGSLHRPPPQLAGSVSSALCQSFVV